MEDTLQSYIDSINNSIDVMRSNEKELKSVSADELPSDFKLMMTGSNISPHILNLLFDTKLDKVIDIVLNKFLSGDFDTINRYIQSIGEMFGRFTGGTNLFKGPIFEKIMGTINACLNSQKFANTKVKIRKAMLLIKELKNRAKEFVEPKMQEKYMQAVYAIKEVMRFIAKIYNNRKIITNKVLKGLNFAIHEEMCIDEDLDFDF